MRTLVLTLTVEGEGRPYEDSPIRLVDAAPIARVFSLTVKAREAYQLFQTVTGITQMTSFILTTTAPITVWINSQLGNGILLDAGGVIAIMGLSDTPAQPLWLMTNDGDVDARLRGVILGLL